MADYDKLTIKIVANTGTAIDSIDRLSSRLEKLENQASKMDFDRLIKLEGILKDISNIDFSKVASGLYNVSKSLAEINGGTVKTLSQSMEDLADVDTSGVEETAEAIENTAKSFETVGKSAETTEEEVKGLIDRISEIGSSDLEESLSNCFEDFLSGVKQSKEEVDNLRKQIVELVATEELENGVNTEKHALLQQMAGVLGKIKQTSFDEPKTSLGGLLDRLHEIESPEIESRLSTMFSDFANGVNVSKEEIGKLKDEVSALMLQEELLNGK
ncbi:MAG: hypothetical protein J5725_01835, partial [Bacteroidales bacterium]|nr:hypothetical protein [Bacteroidales bacterium]